jgi:hypothetical protein
MDNNILLFKNELKNKIVSKYKLIGISSEIILSFDIFPKNPDLEPFVSEVFNAEFRPYVFKSRTLLASRVIRIIHQSTDSEISLQKNKLYKFIEELTNAK